VWTDYFETNCGADRKNRNAPGTYKSKASTGIPLARTEMCHGCGRVNHVREDCTLKSHPQFNKTGSWSGSQTQLLCSSHNIRGGVLPFKTFADGKDLPNPIPPPSERTKKADGEARNKKRKGNEYVLAMSHDIPKPNSAETYISIAYNGEVAELTQQYLNTVNTAYTNSNYTLVNNKLIKTYTLYDNGSKQGNYINKETADRLKDTADEDFKDNIIISSTKTICSCFKDDCRISLGSINLNVFFFNELINLYETFVLKAEIIDSDYDLIIGKPTIIKQKLITKLPTYFSTDTAFIEDEVPPLPIHPNSAQYNTVEGLRSSSKPTHPMLANQCPLERRLPVEDPPPKMALQLLYINERKHVRELLDYEPDNDGVDERYQPPPWDNIAEETELLDMVKIYGPPHLQAKLKTLLTEFSDVFSETVRPIPADIPPMEIEIDTLRWERNCNRGPPRPQSSAKEQEIKKQTDLMLSLNVIQTSTATEYSQVLLTPKPGDKWRFCIDYRRANDVSAGRAWPIPTIVPMLMRIGVLKPKFFCKLDLTSGYFQAPLHTNSRRISAFICFLGIFEWLRVPMGLKGAPAYFQQMLATIVLAGLMYVVCELYIDDIIIPATNEEDLIERLQKVLTRFRKYRITVNPKKCEFGLNEIEYVGHVINETGLSFSKEKIQEVLDFQKPTHMKGLRSFLGLANYFRDHIRNHSIIVKPLHDIVKNYERRKVLQWTPESDKAFIDIQTEISNCPTLFFMDSTAPVVVQTDASDYGIGAYMFQIVDEKETPIAFISKALTPPQCRWPVPEKEAYAIWYALTKWSHLLRDIHFTLQTDHKNLTYINMEGSPKVRRWKIDIQEYDCDVQHIKGEDNPVSDTFSRLCQVNECEHVYAFDDDKIPREFYYKIGTVHNSTVGHHGVERTLAKLQQVGETWVQMRLHVKKFIKSCPLCQKLSHIKPALHTHPFTTSSFNPMEVLNMDTIGPMTSDENGMTYILVIIDCFTRF